MRERRIFWLVCGFTFLYFLVRAQAQEKYPNRQIELVVAFAPGGSADIATRIYSDDLAQALKVPITVVNRAGGAGIQGTSYVVKAKKDGYTLFGSSGTPLVIMPAISKEVTYNPLKDLIPLGHFGFAPSVFAVRSDCPFKTLEELVEYARRNPGKLKNGAGGLGTESYINLEILSSKTKIKITTIPFKSGGEAMPALLGGHVDMSSNTLATIGPQIKAGKLRGLAISSKTRHSDFPNMPTTAELGYPEANFCVWFGTFAPAGVPQSVLNVLIPVLERVFKNPEVVDRAMKAGITVEYKGPEGLRKSMESEIRIVEKVAQEANLIEK